jgi:RHS (Retrotransposon Hot Spot) family protein
MCGDRRTVLVVSQTWVEWPAAKPWLEALKGSLTPIPEPLPLSVPIDPSEDVGPLEQILMAGGVDVNKLMKNMPKWEGMTYVKVESELVAEEPGPMYVVFRQHVMDVVNEVLALLKAGKCVLVTGSPGIGKSASLLPYLVRELVLGGAGQPPRIIVIYDQGGASVVKLKFTVDESGKNTLASSERVHMSKYLPADDRDLRVKDTVLIVDPSKAGGSLDELSGGSVRARVVFVASPNSDHFKAFKAYRSPVQLIVKHWTLQELRAALPYIGDDMTPVEPGWTDEKRLAAWEEAAVRRWVRQGGNPRAVLRTEDVFRDLERATDGAAAGTSANVVERILESPAGLVMDAKLPYLPNSALVTYSKSDKPFRVENSAVAFKSDSVIDRIADEHFDTMMASISHSTGEKRTALGPVFERLALWALRRNCLFEVIARAPSIGACVSAAVASVVAG